MKRSTSITLACSVLVTAGCSHKSHYANYQSSTTSAPTYGDTSTTYNEQIYNQRSTANDYRSSTDISSPQASTTYNQTTIETTPADRTLIQQVQSAIRNDTMLVSIAPSIQVNAQGGTVTLSGNVQSEDQKQAIERAAKGTTGVVTVNNQLQVSGSANQSSQIQSGQSQTGGNQSSLYQNSNRQSQGTISGGVGANSKGSFGASADLKGAGTNDTAQTGSFGKDSSSGSSSDQFSGKRLYSTKDDVATNSLKSATGASGESSLGSTNSASGAASSASDNSFSSGSAKSQKNSDASVSGSVDSADNSSATQKSSDTNSLNSTSPQGGTSSSFSGSTSGTSSTSDKSSSGTSASPNDSSSSLNSTNESSSSPQGGTSSSFGSGASSASSSSSAAGETKNLSPTSSSESSRLYSTNQADQATSGSLSTDSSNSGSGSLALTVQGATEADQKLADQVKQELRSNSALTGGTSQLRISLNNGKATLRGSVKSDQEKQDVEKAIQKVTGVTSVENQLRVNSTSAQSGTEESK